MPTYNNVVGLAPRKAQPQDAILAARSGRVQVKSASKVTP
jgi:hypothetical protein